MLVGTKLIALEIPHERGNMMEVRYLSGIELEDAKDSASNKAIRSYGSLGKEILDAIRENKTPEQIIAEEAAKASKPIEPEDEAKNYDWTFIIDKALANWSGPLYESMQVTSENKLKLDPITREWLAREIVRMNTITTGESQTSGAFTHEE